MCVLLTFENMFHVVHDYIKCISFSRQIAFWLSRDLTRRYPKCLNVSKAQTDESALPDSSRYQLKVLPGWPAPMQSQEHECRTPKTLTVITSLLLEKIKMNKHPDHYGSEHKVVVCFFYVISIFGIQFNSKAFWKGRFFFYAKNNIQCLSSSKKWGETII